MSKAVSPITGAEVRTGLLAGSDMLVRTYAHEADGFDDLLLGSRLADDLRFGAPYADGGAALSTEDARLALALVRSYLWRSKRGLGKPPIVVGEAELAWKAASLGRLGLTRDHPIRAIEDLAAEARALTFQDRCDETLLNLRHEADGGRLLLTNPYAAVVGRDLVFKAKEYSVVESGITYGCSETDAPFVYDYLKREGMIEAPPTGGLPQGFSITGRGYAAADRMRVAAPRGSRSGAAGDLRGMEDENIDAKAQDGRATHVVHMTNHVYGTQAVSTGHHGTITQTVAAGLPSELQSLASRLSELEGGALSPESSLLLQQAAQGQSKLQIAASAERVAEKGEGHRSLLSTVAEEVTKEFAKKGVEAGIGVASWLYAHGPTFAAALSIALHRGA